MPRVRTDSTELVGGPWDFSGARGRQPGVAGKSSPIAEKSKFPNQTAATALFPFCSMFNATPSNFHVKTQFVLLPPPSSFVLLLLSSAIELGAKFVVQGRSSASSRAIGVYWDREKEKKEREELYLLSPAWTKNPANFELFETVCFWGAGNGERLPRSAHCERRERWCHSWFRYCTLFFFSLYLSVTLGVALITNCSNLAWTCREIVLFSWPAVKCIVCFIKFQFLCCSVLNFLFPFRSSWSLLAMRLRRSR